MYVGEKIRELRKAAGLTQKQLADKSRLATITIQQYESGKRKPRLESLVKIASALDVDLHEIAGTHISWPGDPDTEEEASPRIWIKERSQTFGDVIDLLLFVMNDFPVCASREGKFYFDNEVPGSDIITLFLKDYKKMLSLVDDGTITAEYFSSWFKSKRAELGKIKLKDEKRIDDYMALEVIPRIANMKDKGDW